MHGWAEHTMVSRVLFVTDKKFSSADSVKTTNHVYLKLAVSCWAGSHQSFRSALRSTVNWLPELIVLMVCILRLQLATGYMRYIQDK